MKIELPDGRKYHAYDTDCLVYVLMSVRGAWQPYEARIRGVVIHVHGPLPLSNETQSRIEIEYAFGGLANREAAEVFGKYESAQKECERRNA